jgi:alkylation response protein AidB-like acyl-CoA dehydrogenase
MGITMIGPLLIRYGTEAQRARFLPRILAGEDIWCQGYSEPNAGSDLAALRTEAVLDGDHYIVNGSKIWTTLANDANWIFLLVRTDRAAKKQEGISFLLAPMDSPGITVRPIVTLDRHDEFCEVFFDNVRVPAENLVGQPNKGWTMAKALLGFERIFLGSPKQSTYALAKLAQVAAHMGVADDPVFVDCFTRLRMDLEDLKALYETQVAKLRRGEELGAEVSMLKVWQSELYQRIAEAALEIAGEEGAMANPIGGNRALNPGSAFIQSRVVSIYGGSNEIQRGIIAKNVLGLPG